MTDVYLLWGKHRGMKNCGRILLHLGLATCIISCSTKEGNPKKQLPMTFADAMPQEDSGSETVDSGMSSADTGSQTQADSGAMLTPSCMELAECCADAPPQLQAQCDSQLAANDENACRSTIEMAQGFGLCLPPDYDAGMRGDSGPLGPRCERLLECCASITIDFLKTACENAALDGDEAICDMRIDQGNGLNAGFCPDLMDAGFVDAGTSTVGMDAGTSTVGMDAGTSTVGMDAGTSTTGVDAGTDAGI